MDARRSRPRTGRPGAGPRPAPGLANPALANPALATLALTALALAAGPACGPAPTGGDERPPDVVVFLLDTLRSDRLGCYGFPAPTSPRIDRLAREGALFTDVTAQATWTLPSMVSILHGRYLTAFRDRLDPALPVLAERFQEAGYRTIALVGNKGVTAGGGFDRGFDVFDSRARDMAALERDLGSALAELDGRDPRRPPIFLYLHAMDPHMPYLPRPTLDAELPPVGAPPPMPRPWQSEVFTHRGSTGPEDDPDWSERWAFMNAARGRYDQGVRHTDDGLGRILDGLEARGLLERAVVAVLSDHGEVLWERVSPADPSKVDREPPDRFFYREHGAHLTQETVATPLVLWGAGVPSGLRHEGAVENVDLAPTLLALCGLPVDGGLHGRNLLELAGGEAPARDYAFSFNHAALAVREVASGLKLIEPLPDPARYALEPQLYHLPSDPEELTNLYADRPADVARLATELARWREAHPTADTLGIPLDAELEQTLRELGYTDVDIGR